MLLHAMPGITLSENMEQKKNEEKIKTSVPLRKEKFF